MTAPAEKAPPSAPCYRHVIVTDVGQVRERNEDLAWGNNDLGLFLLADGMGGHPDGNVASRMAIETASALLTDEADASDDASRGERMAEAILAANQAIMLASAQVEAPEAVAGMGTTLSCLWLHEGRAEVAHVGDSRIYRWHGGKIEQLTRDHTVASELISRGVLEAGTLEARQLGHILTQAVGLERDLRPDVFELESEAGDIYLLCSDGLSDLVSAAAMAHLIGEAEGDLRVAAESLVHAALEAGGYDNVTVVLARREESPCT